MLNEVRCLVRGRQPTPRSHQFQRVVKVEEMESQPAVPLFPVGTFDSHH